MSDLTAIATAMRDDIAPYLDDMPDDPRTKLAMLITISALLVPVSRADFDAATAAARHTLAGYAKTGRSRRAGPVLTH